MKYSLLIAALAFPIFAAAQHNDSDWKFEDQETLHRTFQVAAGDNASNLQVNEMSGFIHVTGGPGSAIQVTVEKRLRAESQADLDRAKRDVKLGATQEGNTVKLFEDGPFRSSDGSVHWDSDREHYRVVMNFEIQVPAGVQLDLHTLNGAIEVKKTSGDFKAHTLNGKVDIQEVAGAGAVNTLNGAVKVAFAKNPAHASSFHTLNGPIDVYLQPNPDADISFHTLRGGVYSDFDVTTVPTTIKGGSGNRFIYRTGGDMKVRAGKGGPELSFHTLNGAIRLHSKAI